MAIAKWARGGAWGASAIYGCVQTVTSLVCKGRYYCEKCKGWHRVTQKETQLVHPSPKEER